MDIARRVVLRVLGHQVGTFTLPKDHLFGMRVPDGGSSCAKCLFVSDDGKHCGNPYFQDWRKSLKEKDPSLLPHPADSYCCDVFQAQGSDDT